MSQVVRFNPSIGINQLAAVSFPEFMEVKSVSIQLLQLVTGQQVTLVLFDKVAYEGHSGNC